MKKYTFLFIILLIGLSVKSQVPYKNAKLPIEKRVDDLLSRMTYEEKVWQCFMIPGDLSEGKEKYKHGIFGLQVSTKGKTDKEGEQLLDYSQGGTAEETAILINKIQQYFVEETRLGIPIIAFDEALHGLVRQGATAFPQAIALAATWDTALMHQVAYAIAMETKSRGIRQILSPVLNIARDVRWGRVEETYGQDPYLTSQMAMAYISQFENHGIITTPKHFIANVGAGGRDSYPIHFNERLLEEIYFPAFKDVFQKAGARSVMTSYNSLDGRQCSANNWLLNKKLKEEWSFDGFVISDANAVGGANVLHYTSESYAESGKQSIENGLDVIFQTSHNHFNLFYPSLKDEELKLDETKLNEAVRRILKAKFELGLFENPYIDIKQAAKWNGIGKHKKIAKQAALESIVLLKNNDHTLPFNKNAKSIAIIGNDAVEARLGGYSGPGNQTISILQGIKNKLGDFAQIRYSSGCGRENQEFETINAEYLSSSFNNKETIGLLGEYFKNITLEGEPVFKRNDKEIDFRWTLFSPDQNQLAFDWYSVRWTGKLKSPKTGIYQIGIKGNDGYRLFLNNKLIIDNWHKQSSRTITKDYYFEKNKEYDIKIEFYENVGSAWFKLIWNIENEESHQYKIDEAIDLVNNSELAVLVVGIEEGEGHDRAYLNLPGHQEEMIEQIAAIGKPLAIVLVGGSAITMNKWIDKVPAIIDIWYPGDEGGNALADVLFGDYNPAGRLPITFPVFEGQLPLYYNHKPTGRNDDYMNITGKPLFPFGYGLSYTTFEYSNLSIKQNERMYNPKTEAIFTISNTGNYDGDEVIQLYIRDEIASVARPIMELKGFQRVHLKAGESKEFVFNITPDLLSMLNEDMDRVVESGAFKIMIGRSSGDILLRTTIYYNSLNMK